MQIVNSVIGGAAWASSFPPSTEALVRRGLPGRVWTPLRVLPAAGNAPGSCEIAQRQAHLQTIRSATAQQDSQAAVDVKLGGEL
ncbi:MAG: hypothetical protein JWO72_1749 [Caulobacteraceae bacterium]|nr:hypothetical protein [Caulobacteraceae bacterium]